MIYSLLYIPNRDANNNVIKVKLKDTRCIIGIVDFIFTNNEKDKIHEITLIDSEMSPKYQ